MCGQSCVFEVDEDVYKQVLAEKHLDILLVHGERCYLFEVLVSSDGCSIRFEERG